MILNEVASLVFQLLVVLVIALVVHFFTRRRIAFSMLIGLQEAKISRIGMVMCLLLVALYLPLQQYLLGAIVDQQSKYDLRSPEEVVVLLIWGIFRTALGEELLFRGVILNGLAVAIGRLPANLIQALGFTAIHGFVFVNAGFPHGQFVQWALLFLSIFVVSVLFVAINDRFGHGSIFPSWLVHGLGNVLTQYFLFFSAPF